MPRGRYGWPPEIRTFLGTTQGQRCQALIGEAIDGLPHPVAIAILMATVESIIDNAPMSEDQRQELSNMCLKALGCPSLQDDE